MMALILSGVMISGIAMPGIAYGEEFYSGDPEEMVTEESVDSSETTDSANAGWEMDDVEKDATETDDTETDDAEVDAAETGDKAEFENKANVEENADIKENTDIGDNINYTEGIYSADDIYSTDTTDVTDPISGFEDGLGDEKPILQEIPAADNNEALEDGETISEDEEIWITEEGETIEVDSMDASATGFDAARMINTNTTYTGNFTQSTKTFWFKFIVPNNGNLSFGFKHDYLESGSRYWQATIYTDGNHDELAGYGFAGNKILYNQKKFGVAAGTYYLKIEDYYFSDANFNFRINYESFGNWETELNDTYQNADSINVNNMYYGSLQRGGDVDWYKFSISQNGSVSIDFNHDYMEMDSLYWKIELYNEQYELLEYDRIGGHTLAFNGSKCGLPAGTYYLKIYPDIYYSDLEYGLRVNYTASDAWETEFNDNYSTADPINLNTTYYGNLQNGRNDVDWYKFTASSAGRYDISFSHDYVEVENSRLYWVVQFYDNMFNEKGKFRYCGDKKIESNKVELPNGGIYYIKISKDIYSSSMPYSFKITPHIHSYSKQITKATLSEDGVIIPKCSCGVEDLKIVIPHPAKISLSKTKFTYNGKSQQPKVTVYDSASNVISPSNYIVSYEKSRKSVGTHKVKIKFKKNYSGTTYRSYEIRPKTPTLKSVSKLSRGFLVKWSKVSSVSGYQIQYSTNKKFTRSRIGTVEKKSATSVRVIRLSAKKKYYVRIRSFKYANGSTYYSSWSKTKNVTTKR